MEVALGSILFIPGQFSKGSHAGSLKTAGRPAEEMSLPGYGGSPAPEDSSFDTDFILSQIDAAVPEGKVVLAGNSAGAQWAILWAARHPTRVERLILLNPGGFWAIPPAGVDLFMKDYTPEKLAKWDEAGIRKYFGALFTNEQAREAYLRDLLKDGFDPKAASAYIRRSFETSVYAPLGIVGSLGIHADIILGTADSFLQLDPIRQAAFADPMLHLHEIAGCGHMPQLDCPDETERILRKILN
ncbi:MAG: hypothetical protein AUJ52_11590 [Elusimicrobia bacterium CG1_02_63_36]|nr:MAG: hypothetical protein AUJ52_11590 [Elusimicrobia bacterium CG1_02_63_36]PIP85143.1 MAG: hypothetical protein COR54_00345 [Elusimicrobia bacterium CG22_combo_CG10-13_8_21_14_all_63_91]PJA15772.1 MAG: hypothetical protein COX66_09090 [Elusimicrobia bacterium CG_4_10_14_0_2_um_filter_63_34]PJB24864.1 MAG: hypothetical protein CO113_11580 [Elusimicrobia bacterium CG_4_9_14_3_um_filter_62_55]